MALAWARTRALFVVTCTLEVERGVDDFGSRCVSDQLGGREGVSYSEGYATVDTLQVETELLLEVYYMYMSFCAVY